MLMIMKSNSKKCSTMRKFITTMLIAAAAFTACVQNDEVVVPNNNDKITFTATVTAPQTRTVLVEEGGKFHAEWQNDDVIEVFEVTDVAQDGTKKYQSNLTTVVVDGTNSTANVELNVFDTATSYSYVLTTTNASMNGGATYLGLTLPSAQAPAAMNTFDGASDIIVSKRVQRTSQPAAGETISFDNIRISAIAQVNIKNLNLSAGDEVVSVTFDCANYIAGKQTKIYLDDIESGDDPFKQSEFDEGKSKKITVTLPEAQTDDFTYYMNLWPTTLEAGTTYVVTVVTKDSKFIKNGTIPADNPLVFSYGEMTAITVDMSTAAVDIVASSDYVTVAGIKWATGNLWYDENGDTETGFVNNWSIAPNQYYCITNSLDGYTTRDVFNFGGISDPFSNSLDSAAKAEQGQIISGKMYTDAECIDETTVFADAEFGDIAFWASKGQYRMPTVDEFTTLIDEANSVYAQFNGIHGIYFWDPADGEARTTASATGSSKEIILTKEQLNNGVFFPGVGRGFNSSTTIEKIYLVNNPGTTFMYRAGAAEIEANWLGTATKHNQIPPEGYYGVVADLKRSGVDRSAANPNQMDIHYCLKDTGVTARLPIRPIYIAE